jgi:pilus assembly protein Flp/PilA
VDPVSTFIYFRAWLATRTDSERGASLVEYALLVALIAVVCVGAVTFIGTSANSKLSTVGSSLS